MEQLAKTIYEANIGKESYDERARANMEFLFNTSLDEVAEERGKIDKRTGERKGINRADIDEAYARAKKSITSYFTGRDSFRYTDSTTNYGALSRDTSSSSDTVRKLALENAESYAKKTGGETVKLSDFGMISQAEAGAINYNIRELPKFLASIPADISDHGQLTSPPTDLGRTIVDLFNAFKIAFSQKDRVCIEKMKELQKVLGIIGITQDGKFGPDTQKKMVDTLRTALSVSVSPNPVNTLRGPSEAPSSLISREKAIDAQFSKGVYTIDGVAARYLPTQITTGAPDTIRLQVGHTLYQIPLSEENGKLNPKALGPIKRIEVGNDGKINIFTQ